MKPRYLLPLVVFAVSCGGEPAPRTLKPGEKPYVLASALHLACIASLVGGDDAKVELLPPEQTDPHGFEPTAQDRRRLESAHLLLINGLGLESFDVSGAARGAGVRVVDCSNDAPKSFLIESGDHGHDHADHGHGHGHAEYDPHLWLSAEGAGHQADAIASALGALDPQHQKSYIGRAEALKKRLLEIRDEFKPKISALPNRRFATDHDAFAYFAREAGLGEASFIRKTPGRQITVEQRRQLEHQLAKAGARAIFIEPGHDDKVAREVAASLNIKVATLDPFEIGKLDPAAFEQTYRRNLQAVLDALSG